jgi:hydrogenase-4 component B
VKQIPISGLFLGRLTARRMVFCLFVCLFALLEGIVSFAAIPDVHETLISIPSGVPFLQYTFRLNPLLCYFNLALAAVSLAVSVYSLGYLDGFDVRKPFEIFCFFYSLLLISFTVVFTANHAFLFLIAWRVTALSAYFLVSFDHERDESRSACILVLVMSHVGTGALMVAFLLLGTWGRNADSHAARLALTLVLFGFGVKASMIPVHIWLPAAQTVPNKVSALMSAIRIKTGIYGIIRIWFDLLGIPFLWFGPLVLTAGTASAILSVLCALIEPDLKRMQASYGRPTLAAIAWVACLFHIFNHAAIKSLLFLSAGAVVHATVSRNLERLGGLIRPMLVFGIRS